VRLPPLVDPVVVLFGEAPRGRVTGWAVACSAHGAMPVLVPGRVRAVGAASAHLEHEHAGHGMVVESPRPLPAAKVDRGAAARLVLDELTDLERSA